MCIHLGHLYLYMSDILFEHIVSFIWWIQMFWLCCALNRGSSVDTDKSTKSGGVLDWVERHLEDGTLCPVWKFHQLFTEALILS